MQTIDLCGSGWRVTQGESSGREMAGETIPACVPGCVHTDLLAAGRIEDPHFRDNEDRVQWVTASDWTYARSFSVPKDFLENKRILLRCEGLDTLAEVRLNGKLLGRTDNMFRTWELDAAGAVRPGENHIEVHFLSPIPFITEKQKIRAMPSWGSPREIRGRGWLRKEPCSFGWDWGPALASCGIWKPIALVGFSQARLSDVRVSQDHSTAGRVKLAVRIEADKAQKAVALRAKVSVSLDGKVVAQAAASEAGDALEAGLDVAAPALWWPNGMGAQPLYDVAVELTDAKGAVLDTRTLRIGLRTLRLDRHPDQWGESFQFVVNGIPFFAKGANWIPADSFVTRISAGTYGDLLGSAREANMNMLRVWGGGIYESDTFYELCDRMGLCIWQDFMFACSGYPGFDTEFLANVRAEAEGQVRRIRHHPSIALWCGNNELEQGLVGDGWTNTTMSWKDYGALFDELLPDVVRRLDPQRDYWPCSPHTPVGDRKDFNNPNSGDAHLWSVWHGRLPFEWYRTCTHRFNSEFGFQSFPEESTVRTYTAPQDRNVTTAVMEHHQKSGIGNTLIMQYLLDWFRLPGDFSMTLRLSQILQGMAMKYAVEHWRRAMPRGMGTLYWQINDCWPVASWSSIDYFGRWKALHYMARDFNAPLLVSGFEDSATGTVEVHVTSDLLEAARVEVAWRVTDVAGALLAGETIDIEAPARSNRCVTTLALSRHIQEKGPRGLLVWLELRRGGAPVSSNLVLFSRPKHLELLEPSLSVQVTEAGSDTQTFDVTVDCRAPALWVWLELEGIEARFSKSYFHAMPDRPTSVRLTTTAPVTRTALESGLRARSLRDTYV